MLMKTFLSAGDCCARVSKTLLLLGNGGRVVMGTQLVHLGTWCCPWCVEVQRHKGVGRGVSDEGVELVDRRDFVDFRHFEGWRRGRMVAVLWCCGGAELNGYRKWGVELVTFLVPPHHRNQTNAITKILHNFTIGASAHEF